MRGAVLDGKRLKLTDPERLPFKGIFSVRAVGIRPSHYSDAALSEEDFKSRWGVVCACMPVGMAEWLQS